MKLITIITLSCVLMAAFAWQQRQEGSEAKKQAAALTGDLQRKSNIIKDQKTIIHQLRDQLDAYQKESAALRERIVERPSTFVTQQEAAPSAAVPQPRAAKAQFAKMFDDPKMKHAFRQQYILQLKQTYSDFIKERHLDSSRAQRFFDLLADQQLQETDQALTAFNNRDPG